MLTPLKAIRQNCLDCMNGNANEVKLCPSVKCPLFPFRFGKNPNIKGGTFTEEQKAKSAERLKLWRNAQKNGTEKR